MIQKNIECLIAKLYSRFYISIKYCGNASKDIILREYDGNNGAGIKDKILRVSTAGRSCSILSDRICGVGSLVPGRVCQVHRQSQCIVV